MPITAKLRYLRISPRKVRLVTDLIKGMKVEEAEGQLKFLTKRAAKPILKLLNSAVANAQHNANLAKEGLYIAKIIVEAGPILKRWQPRAMGRATPIMKRTSHITLVLDQQEPISPQEEKPVEEEAKPAVRKKEKPKKKEPELLEKAQKVAEEEEPAKKPKPVPPPKPYPATSRAKKGFLSRQAFGRVKKIFRRKSM